MIITSSTNVFAVDNNSWTDATKTSQGRVKSGVNGVINGKK